jgi:CheY-specific phosphatase CheX
MMESMSHMKEMMASSIFEVFEKMFFIFLEPSHTEVGEYDLESSIRFNGQNKGEIKILFSALLSKRMVQNMLGMDEVRITDQDIEDCAKEAVNMVCGNFLSKLDAESETFDMTIPTFSKPPESSTRAGNHTCRLDFVSDDGEIGASLQLFVDWHVQDQ